MSDSVYYLIGFLIITNIGAIGSGLYFAGRIVWFLAKLDAQVKENTKDVNAAHRKIKEWNEYHA